MSGNLSSQRAAWRLLACRSPRRSDRSGFLRPRRHSRGQVRDALLLRQRCRSGSSDPRRYDTSQVLRRSTTRSVSLEVRRAHCGPGLRPGPRRRCPPGTEREPVPQNRTSPGPSRSLGSSPSSWRWPSTAGAPTIWCSPCPAAASCGCPAGGTPPSYPPVPARLFVVSKTERHAHGLRRYRVYRRITVHWSPPASAQDRMRCHSDSHSGSRSCAAVTQVTVSASILPTRSVILVE